MKEKAFNPTTSFTIDELLTRSHFPCADEMPLMQVAEFNPHQFVRPLGGSKAAAHCGRKEDFADALHFWLWSLQYSVKPDSDDFRPYAREASCDAVSETEYFKIIDAFVSVLKKPAPSFLIERRELVSVTRVFDQAFILNTARSGFLAEYQSHFVAFHSWVYL